MIKILSPILFLVSIVVFCTGIGSYFYGSIAELQSSTNAVLIAIYLMLIILVNEIIKAIDKKA
tara:strand:- start:3844 stop:4032 length:189 start_codon:yes stop_codon:yes gene_type:complete